MVNGKQKGAAGEREFANFCKEKGFNVRRTAQYNGKELESKADVIGIPGIHIEVKRVEKLNIHNAIEQAKRDSKNHDEIPIVAHRKNRTKWLITMDAEDWFRMFYGEDEKDESEEEV